MVYLEGLESIIECIYLNEELDNKISTCEVFVNPSDVKYVVGKTVIINVLGYPKNMVDALLKNNCRIISRVYDIENEKIEVRPYILRLNTNIQWNGRLVEDYGDNLTDLLERNECDFSIDDYMLYFPKIKSLDKGNSKTMDLYGNLTAVGWALQQVGVNLSSNSTFTDLDIVKTKKLFF